jgi:hypothetical protein
MRLRLILAIALAASAGWAQRGGGGGRGRNSGMDTPSLGPSRPNRLEQLTAALQLSKEQKKDVKTLMDDAQKEAAPLNSQITKSRAQVAVAVEGGKQEEIDKAIKEHSELEAQMAAIEMKAFAGIYKVLDNDQRNKTRAVFSTMMPGIFKGKNWQDAE